MVDPFDANTDSVIWLSLQRPYPACYSDIDTNFDFFDRLFTDRQYDSLSELTLWTYLFRQFSDSP